MQSRVERGREGEGCEKEERRKEKSNGIHHDLELPETHKQRRGKANTDSSSTLDRVG
jgi:hypothetical protein